MFVSIAKLVPPSKVQNNMQTDTIKQLIETGLPGAEVCVEGDGRHFTTLVVSDVFQGKSRLERQQMVYRTLHHQLTDGSLHALSIKTLTQAEWNQIDANGDA